MQDFFKHEIGFKEYVINILNTLPPSTICLSEPYMYSELSRYSNQGIWNNYDDEALGKTYKKPVSVLSSKNLQKHLKTFSITRKE